MPSPGPVCFEAIRQSGNMQFTGPLTEAEGKKMHRQRTDGHTYRNDYSDPVRPQRLQCPSVESGKKILSVRKIRGAILGHSREHHAHQVEYQKKKPLVGTGGIS